MSIANPLAGVRVLTFEGFGAGPYGSMHLADLGAEVIKIENRAQGGDASRGLANVIQAQSHAESLLSAHCQIVESKGSNCCTLYSLSRLPC